MTRRVLKLAAFPAIVAATAAFGSDTAYGNLGYGQLNLWAGGGSASAYAQTSAYGGSGDVTVSVSITPSGPGCSGWRTASNSGSGWTAAQADAPSGCAATSATAAAYHTASGDVFTTYTTQ